VAHAKGMLGPLDVELEPPPGSSNKDNRKGRPIQHVAVTSNFMVL
jgi:hypothetical protein